MITNEEGRASHLPSNAPPLPEDVREAARLAPGHWLGVVDPGWRDEGPPPHWAVVGEWRSGESGEVEEWQPNEEYRPSPSALGWPRPADPVDAAVQLAVTGYGPMSDALSALADAEVHFLCTPEGGPLAMTSPDGDLTVPVFTSHEHQPFSASLAHGSLSGRVLAAHGMPLTVNPAGPACLVVGAQDLLRAAGPGGMGAPEDPGTADDATVAPVAAVPGSAVTTAAGGTL